ncbi:MAG: haloacid dehalogenase-like hydrolase [Clostridia bacterium]|nr:haloacid dehalogenase-like hydrolase [Clostridia bacterium]
MANIIAVIWDFDKTLVNGYMQDPIFKEYGVEARAFWDEVNALPDKYWREQRVKVNRETIYLNHFINCAKKGIFPGLNNQKLRAYGRELVFYPGIPDIFERTKALVAGESKYREYDIKVEHYVVSTGMAEIIRGSAVMDHAEAVWGCEFIEEDFGQGRVISELGYTIDNTSKTRAIFEINKGVPQNPHIDVNSKMPESLRRVRFENMIYIADGPSDIPAFSLVGARGGSTFAIYPKGDWKAMGQVEQMRMDGRIDMFAEADYTEGTTADMWICTKIRQIAERIYEAERSLLASSVSDVPRHLSTGV